MKLTKYYTKNTAKMATDSLVKLGERLATLPYLRIARESGKVTPINTKDFGTGRNPKSSPTLPKPLGLAQIATTLSNIAKNSLKRFLAY
jgi:hypothetical protein